MHLCVRATLRSQGGQGERNAHDKKLIRTKDWADLEEMQAAGTLEIGRVMAVLVEYLGIDDERLRRLDGLRGERSKS